MLLATRRGDTAPAAAAPLDLWVKRIVVRCGRKERTALTQVASSSALHKAVSHKRREDVAVNGDGSCVTNVRCDSESASMRTGGSLRSARAKAMRWGQEGGNMTTEEEIAE